MNPYARFATRRVGHALLVMLLVYIFVFVTLSVLPGDPVSNRLRDPENFATEEEVARLLAHYGMDRPVWEQLLNSLGRTLTGDWGYSLLSAQPVLSDIVTVLPTTLVLSSMALAFAIVLGFAIALGGVYLPPKAGGGILRSFPSLLSAVPNFLVGLFLIQIFAFELGWFQIVRDEGLKSLVLPAATLAIPISAPVAQVFISGLDSVRSQHFATIALAKGLRPAQIFAHHLIKPASLPTLTILGLIVGELIGGAVITESVFGINGLGRLVERSVADQDTPVLLAIVVFAAAVYVLINLVVDLCYPLLDPRLRVMAAPSRGRRAPTTPKKAVVA